MWDEVERRITNSNSNYARFHGLLPFCARYPDTLRRSSALADVDNEGGVAGASASDGNAPTTTHPLRVGSSVSKSLAGTIVDEIVKVGRWKNGKSIEIRRRGR